MRSVKDCANEACCCPDDELSADERGDAYRIDRGVVHKGMQIEANGLATHFDLKLHNLPH